MSCEIHLGDIGTVFEVSLTDCDDAAIDLTTATTINFIFLKPDGTTKLTKTGVIYGSAANGVMRYTTISGDLNTLGKWKFQVEVASPTGDWKSNIKSFKVYSNL